MNKVSKYNMCYIKGLSLNVNSYVTKQLQTGLIDNMHLSHTKQETFWSQDLAKRILPEKPVDKCFVILFNVLS